MSAIELFENAPSYTFETYIEMVKRLLDNGKVTGDFQSEEKLNSTKINLHRMKRIYKTHSFLPETVDVITEISDYQTWYVIAEGWCGDAAQNLPIIARLAELSLFVELKIILRDENDFIMDKHLTNGARAIPKLIVFNTSVNEDVLTWGPRPVRVQQFVDHYKANHDIHQDRDAFHRELHTFYAKSNGRYLEKDMQELMQCLVF